MATKSYLGGFELYGNKKQNRNAIMDIQRMSGVKADGLFGPNSLEAYNNMSNNPTVVSNAVKESAPIVANTDWARGQISQDYNGYGSGNIQSPDADSYYSMQNEITGLAPKTGSDGLTAAASWKPLTDIGGTNLFGGKDQTFAQHQNELSNSFHDFQTSTGDTTTSFSDYQKNAGDFARNKNQSFNNYAGLGLGVAGLASSLYSTFGSNGSMAMNKKNMQLMDGQIANNNDIMATRSARAADIKKYFG